MLRRTRTGVTNGAVSPRLPALHFLGVDQAPAAVSGRDREAQAVIDALQVVYRKSLKPIEELSLFHEVCVCVVACCLLTTRW